MDNGNDGSKPARAVVSTFSGKFMKSIQDARLISRSFRSAAVLRRFKKASSKIVVLRGPSHHSGPMPKLAPPWPHAPTHQLSKNGTYFITAGTYLKTHHFRTSQRLDVLQRGLLTVARNFRWELEAWAVFSNHYHFIAHSQSDLENAKSLSQMLGVLHTRTAGWINRLDETPGRKIWHNFCDIRLT